MGNNRYWIECVSEAFEDAGIQATPEQIDTVAGCIEGAHENYGMAFGHDAIPNPIVEENKRLKDEIKREQDKVICSECRGRGIQVTRCGTFECTSQCDKCRGEGRHNP